MNTFDLEAEAYIYIYRFKIWSVSININIIWHWLEAVESGFNGHIFIFMRFVFFRVGMLV